MQDVIDFQHGEQTSGISDLVSYWKDREIHSVSLLEEDSLLEISTPQHHAHVKDSLENSQPPEPNRANEEAEHKDRAKSRLCIAQNSVVFEEKNDDETVYSIMFLPNRPVHPRARVFKNFLHKKSDHEQMRELEARLRL